MRKYDLEYKTDGIFTQFFPISEAGHTAWNQLAAKTENTGKILTFHLDQVLSQFRKCGYSVRRAKKDEAISNCDLLAKLNA